MDLMQGSLLLAPLNPLTTPPTLHSVTLPCIEGEGLVSLPAPGKPIHNWPRAGLEPASTVKVKAMAGKLVKSAKKVKVVFAKTSGKC